MRMEPPPSPAVAKVTRPPATAEELPPDEPPAVRPCFHGLWVTPLILVTLTLRPPNSLAAVRPMGTAPLSRTRDIIVVSQSAIRSLKTSDASVQGQPITGSSSLMPIGRPPKG